MNNLVDEKRLEELSKSHEWAYDDIIDLLESYALALKVVRAAQGYSKFRNREGFGGMTSRAGQLLEESLAPFSQGEKLYSCKGSSQQVYCNDKNCGRRDSAGLHWAMGHPNNKFIPKDSQGEKEPNDG